MCVVIDNGKLHYKTIDDRYLLCNISEVLRKLGKVNYFSTLNLTSGFNYIEVYQEDVVKTTFHIKNYFYQFKRTLSSLWKLQLHSKVVDNILSSIENEKCLFSWHYYLSTLLNEYLLSLPVVLTFLDSLILKFR